MAVIAQHPRIILDLPPLTLVLYPATQRAVLIGPGGVRVISLSLDELCRAARRAREAREKGDV